MQPVILYRAVDFDFEKEELAAMQAHFKCIHNRTLAEKEQLIVGRYAVLPYYKELEEDLAILSSKIINTYEQHSYIADLKNWYQDLKLCTPKTWFQASDVPMDEPGSFVLKGATNSKKNLWRTHMFAEDRTQIGKVLANLMDDTMISMQNIYVRKFVPLKTYCKGINEMPITKEFRFFICDGQVLTGAFYWSSHVYDLEEAGIPVPDVSEVPKEFLNDVIGRVGSNARFWVLDVAETEAGDWIVVELNDGQMSGLSENDPKVLYKNLAAVLN
jgi:hypothetical protein